jgi:aspartate carbamoyltransferase catalytic subunit
MKLVTLVYFFTTSTRLRVSFDYAKRSFYRAAYAIFGKVGRIASEEVILHLLTTISVFRFTIIRIRGKVGFEDF